MSDPENVEASTPGPRAQERAARKAARASEKAARAQARADEARREALEAAVAGGLIDARSAGATPRSVDAVSRTADTPPAAGPRGSTAVRPASPGGADASSARAPRRARTPMDPRRRRVVVAVLLVVALVMAGLAAWAAVGWRSSVDDQHSEQRLRSSPDEATEAAKGIVTDMFTYDWQGIGPKMDAVETRLTGDAEKEFRTSSRPAVESAAKEQKASVFSTVAAIAPIEIVDTDHVRELVMLNRMVSTDKDPKAQSASSRIEVLMSRVDGTWKLEKLKAI